MVVKAKVDSIQYLPVEMGVGILDRLDSKSLCTAILTCRAWRERAAQIMYNRMVYFKINRWTPSLTRCSHSDSHQKKVDEILSEMHTQKKIEKFLFHIYNSCGWNDVHAFLEKNDPFFKWCYEESKRRFFIVKVPSASFFFSHGWFVLEP